MDKQENQLKDIKLYQKQYKEDPKVSWERIVEHMHEFYPIATDKQMIVSNDL